MGLAFGLSLANHSDSGFFLVVPTLFSQNGFQQGGFWEVVRHMASPFDLSLTLPVGGGLLVPRSSCHKITHKNVCYGAWPGWAVSVSVLPLTVRAIITPC